MKNRIVGAHYWFLSQPIQVGFFGTEMTDAHSYALTNVRSLLLGESTIFSYDEATNEHLSQVRQNAMPPESWTPNVLFTYPGYQCFPIGPGSLSLNTLIAALNEIVTWSTGQHMRAISFLYVGPEETLFKEALHLCGFRRFPITLEANSALPGSTCEDYLAQLPITIRRYVQEDMRRVSRRLQEAGVVIRIRPLLECLNDVVKLRCLHREKYGHAGNERQERAWMEKLARELPDLVTVFCAEVGGKVISFCLFVRERETWHALCTGSDYDEPRSRYSYFAAVFYQPLAIAYMKGLRRISYGIAAEEAKRRRGCQMVMTDGWVRALAPDLEESVHRACTVLAGWEARTLCALIK